MYRQFLSTYRDNQSKKRINGIAKHGLRPGPPESRCRGQVFATFILHGPAYCPISCLCVSRRKSWQQVGVTNRVRNRMVIVTYRST